MHGSWLLFCNAPFIVIALPSVATAKVVLFKGKNYCYLLAITLERVLKEQSTATKNEAKKIRSNDFIESNRENFNIPMAI